MTPSGIEPATFRFVGQCLNQLQEEGWIFKERSLKGEGKSWITAWGRVRLQKLIFPQLHNKFVAFYTLRKPITLFTTVSFPSLSWARSIQFTPPSICSKACFNIILPSKPRSSKLPLPLRFSHQNLYALLLFPYVSHAPSISFPFIWSFGCLVMATNHKTTHDDTSSTPLLLHLSYGQMSCAPVLEHLQPLFLSQCPWPRFTPTQNNRQNYSSECLICIFLDNKSTEGRIWTRW